MSAPLTVDALEKLLAQGKFDEVISACDQILSSGSAPASTPSIRLDEVRSLRDTALRRRKLMQRAAGTASNSLQVRQFKCASCGATLNVRSADSVSIVCTSCGQGATLEGDKYLRGAQYGRPSTPRYTKFLKLGDRGSLNDSECEVIGRIFYESRTEEWDSEDSRYTNERWDWEEVCLITERREFWYLVGDREAFYLAKPFTPRITNTITQRPDFLDLSGSGPSRVLERGVATATSFEGEFSWLPVPEEKKAFAEYVFNRTTYSVEWRGDQSATEVEFFRSTQIQLRSLLIAFGCSEALATFDSQQKRKRQYLVWAGVYASVALVLFAIGSINSSMNGRAIFEATVPRLSLIADEGEVHGPLEMTSVGTVYSIGLRTELPDNSESWAGVELLDENQDAINSSQGDFWRESGRDEDGPWSERDVLTEKVFVLTKPGRYYLRLFGESGLNGGDGPLYVKVSEGRGIGRYYFISGVLALLGVAATILAGTSDKASSKAATVFFHFIMLILLGMVIVFGVLA